MNQTGSASWVGAAGSVGGTIGPGKVGAINDHPLATGLSVPIDLSTSFEVAPGAVDFAASALEPGVPLFYARWQSPTVRACEEVLARLEGADASLCFASGMAAITSVMLHILSVGDHVVLPEICYAGVAEFGHDTLPRLDMEISRVDASDVAAIRDAVRPNTRLVHVETS